MTLANTIARVAIDAQKLGATLAAYEQAGAPTARLHLLDTALLNFSDALRHTSAALSAATIDACKAR